MDEETLIGNISEALLFLKEGEILCTVEKKNRTFFAQKKDRILCQTPLSSFTLSLREFKELYGDTRFLLYRFDVSSSIDPLKDEEYYRWNPLKK